MPDDEYTEKLESYQPRFDKDILAKLVEQVGLETPDSRVYSLMSIMLEKKLAQIMAEVQSM